MAALGQVQIKEALAGSDTIKRLRAMDKEGLMEALGIAQRYKAALDYLAQADALQGKAREEMNKKLDERLTPRVDGYDLEWMIRDAQRAAKPDKGEGSTACAPV